ncbi:hypothetical protein ACLOJK_001136 [Asimina triloba]
MTNAPFMLNMDCDMFVRNPEIVLHAMCLHLGAERGKEFAFVQFPQLFHGSLKDDPFGNETLTVLHKIMGYGFVQGPPFEGTGCVHRRKVIYGSKQEDEYTEQASKVDLMNDYTDRHEYMSKLDATQRRFGCSAAFVESATNVMLGMHEKVTDHLLSSSVEAAKEVAGCNYEQNTCWGNEVGLVYGCTAEDLGTTLRIQSMGWSSGYCTPDPPGFLGTAPTNSVDYLIQQKRWAAGGLDLLIGRYSPVLATIRKQLRFRQCLLYVSDPALWVIFALFIYYNIYSVVEYRNCGFSVRAWWNNRRMRRITSASSWLFALFVVLLKLLGWSETVFEVTRKEQSPSADGSGSADLDSGRFTFNSSPLFLPGTTIVIVHIAALMVALMRAWTASAPESLGWGLGEVVCSIFVLLNYLPFVKGLFGKGCHGIPWPTLCKATALGCIIIHHCVKGVSPGLKEMVGYISPGASPDFQKTCDIFRQRRTVGTVPDFPTFSSDMNQIKEHFGEKISKTRVQNTQLSAPQPCKKPACSGGRDDHGQEFSVATATRKEDYDEAICSKTSNSISMFANSNQIPFRIYGTTSGHPTLPKWKESYINQNGD